MSYNPGIPTANQTFKETQGPINTNFTQANTAFGIDHVNFATATNQGQHHQVTFDANNVPGVLPADPHSIIFTKNNIAGHPFPFFVNSQLGAVANALPFLPDLVTSGSNFGFKIGNIIFNGGSVNTTSAGAPINFAVPFTLNVFSLTGGVVSTGTSTTLTFNSVGLTTANVKVSSGSSTTTYYFAIGN